MSICSRPTLLYAGFWYIILRSLQAKFCATKIVAPEHPWQWGFQIHGTGFFLDIVFLHIDCTLLRHWKKIGVFCPHLLTNFVVIYIRTVPYQSTLPKWNSGVENEEKLDILYLTKVPYLEGIAKTKLPTRAKFPQFLGTLHTHYLIFRGGRRTKLGAREWPRR